MPGQGTLDRTEESWFTINGNRCYVNHKIYHPKSISFPKKYRNKLPCIIKIEEQYMKGGKKGKFIIPELFVLRDHMLLNKVLLEGKKGIQAGKCDGWVIPIEDLHNYEPGSKLV